MAQNVVGRLNFVDCVIYQADEAQTHLRQVAAWGEKNPFGRSILNPLIIPFGGGITGQVAQLRQPINVGDLSNDQSYIPDTQPARSEIFVPLMLRGRVVGVIESEHPEPNAFGAVELEILTTLAAMTGAKLELLAESQRSAQRYNDLVAAHAQLMQETDFRKALEAKLFDARQMEAVGKLAGRFAHEFNNLLTVILGNLELMDPGPDETEGAQCLGDARFAAERGARLVRDLLAMAQRTRLEPREVDLGDVAIGPITGPAARLVVQRADGLWRISVDRKAVENAVQHLVEDALDAMGPQGDVVIRVENILRTMADNTGPTESMPPGRYVGLCVSDTGPGIPPDRMAQIFDPFYTSQPVQQGTGLGLSIVKGLTQQSGGHVTVSSNLGQGSSFCLLFPALEQSGNDLLTMNQWP